MIFDISLSVLHQWLNSEQDNELAKSGNQGEYEMEMCSETTSVNTERNHDYISGIEGVFFSALSLFCFVFCWPELV